MDGSSGRHNYVNDDGALICEVAQPDDTTITDRGRASDEAIV